MLNNQEKQRILEKYYFLGQQIERKLLEREEWHDRACKMTVHYSNMPRIREHTNRVEVAVEKIDQLEREIDRETTELIQLKREIEQVIHSVPNDTLQLLLEYRYLDHLAWEKIADKMNYDLRWLFRLHKKALSQLTIKSY